MTQDVNVSAVEPTQESRLISRRSVIATAAAGAAGLGLAACSSSADPQPTSSATDQTPTTSTDTATASASSTGTAIGAVSDVPVGSAVVKQTGDNTGYVLAQPSKGKIDCHSAVCPHQGCLVTQVQGDVVTCPCHGSEFNVNSGDVLRGPAQTGLAKASVTVKDGNIYLGSS